MENKSTLSDEALLELLSLTITVDESGNKIWRNHAGEIHRVNGPAVVYADGGSLYYRNGILHRADGPAVAYPDGSAEYYLNGELHRTDGPAVERTANINGFKGYKEYWINGERVKPFQND